MSWSIFSDPWVIVGFLGQALFGARFIVQWLVSERMKRSVIPLPFWFLSIGGGSILLTYAISQGDPVFIAGQGLGLFIYMRNLFLIYRGDSRQEDLKSAALPDGPDGSDQPVIPEGPEGPRGRSPFRRYPVAPRAKLGRYRYPSLGNRLQTRNQTAGRKAPR